MSIQKALIVAKKSAYQTYFNEYQTRPLRRLARRGDKALRHIRRSHDVHYETLEHVKAVLKERKISAHACFRGEFFDPKKYDLVISVGGDGSFLEASHRLDHQMILGVNSDTKHSVGNFCEVDRRSFKKRLDDLLSGRFHVKKLNRLCIRLNGKALHFFPLNDILVSHACPAAMSHYILKIGRSSEPQRSSGVWISTAGGSTGAAHSAGGKALPLTSRKIQYVPRELFEGHGRRYRLRGGVLAQSAVIEVVSQMQEGVLYLDGAHHAVPFEYGDRIRVFGGPPLNAVSFGKK